MDDATSAHAPTVSALVAERWVDATTSRPLEARVASRARRLRLDVPLERVVAG